MMLTLLTTLRTQIAKRAEYRRTRNALAGLPQSVADDVGISVHDAARIARHAVWG